MLSLKLHSARARPLKVLCLGAHGDDLEIGCGGTLLEWMDQPRGLDVTWVVLSAAGLRGREARRSAAHLLRRAHRSRVEIHELPDGLFPATYESAKAVFESLKAAVPDPDLILTHRLEDRHQDHRSVAELSWQTWRNQLILEYEIPKYEGDLGHPNIYVPVSARNRRRKVAHLLRHFGTQRTKSWFRTETFDGLMQLRAAECRAQSGFAEAFHLRKATLMC